MAGVNATSQKRMAITAEFMEPLVGPLLGQVFRKQMLWFGGGMIGKPTFKCEQILRVSGPDPWRWIRAPQDMLTLSDLNITIVGRSRKCRSVSFGRKAEGLLVGCFRIEGAMQTVREI